MTQPDKIKEWACKNCERKTSTSQRILMIQCVNCGGMMVEVGVPVNHLEESTSDWMEQAVNAKLGRN